MEKWRPSSAESCGAEIHMAKTRSRSPATDPLSFHFPISISLRLQCSTAKKQYQRTHTLRRPDANCCSSRSPVSTFHLNRTDRITKPNQQHDLYYIHTILQASTTTTAHSDRRPRNRRADIITTASPTNRAETTWEAPLRRPTEAYPQRRRLLPTAPPPRRPGIGVSCVTGLMSGRII